MKRRLARFYRRVRRALSPGSVLPREHARNGDVARDSGDWAAAKDHYLKAVGGDPSLEAIWVQLGHAHKISSDFQMAETAYRRALQLDARNADTWLQLGHVLRLQGSLVEARNCYEKSAVLSPDNANAVREAASLGADASVLSQAHVSTRRPGSSVSYSSRLIGQGPLLIDVTAAVDVGGALVAAIGDAFSCHRDHPVDVVEWREGGWRTLTGETYETTNSCVALVAIGPWSVYRADHAQALRHYVLHRGVPVIGGLMDLTPILDPQLLSTSSINASGLYLQLLSAISSGVLALQGVDAEEVRAIVRHFTPNVGNVAARSGLKDPIERTGEHIQIVGIECSGEMQVIRRAVELLQDSEAARYRFVSPSDCPAAAGGAGGVLLSADVQTMLYGQRMIEGGLPVALGARRGLSAFAPQAALRMPLLDARLTASNLKAFASICADYRRMADATTEGDPNALGVIADWRIREGNLSDGAELTFISDALSEDTPLLDGRVTILPSCLPQIDSGGLRLGRDPTDIGVAPGNQETVAMLLVTSEQAFGIISVKTGNDQKPVQTYIAAAAAKWIKIHLPARNTACTVSISVDPSAANHVHLLAVCLYPTNNPSAWASFLDQIARGAYPRLKTSTKKIAEFTP